MSDETARNGHILVVGSSNTDMVVRTGHLPRPGETVLGGTFMMNPGGKGANQAVAVARLGMPVTFVCKTGQDIFGSQTVELFKSEGIDTTYVFADPCQPSGVALISVDEKGENCIAVASGANATLSPADIDLADDAFMRCDMLLMQLETPMDTVCHAAEKAFRLGKRVVLNPAPAQKLPESLLRTLYLITPNETEAGIISGVEVVDEPSALEAARVIKGMGVKNVIITMGSKGALVCSGDEVVMVKAHKVTPVDTTAAGDVFNGALVVDLAEGKNMVEAAEFACKAGAISVTRAGAQASAPYRHEVENFGRTEC